MAKQIDRRVFLKSSALGVVPLADTASVLGGAQGDSSLRTYREAAKDVPVVEEADVVVCGGGPAGVAAAIAAARTGAKARLIEVNGCLGGIWTAGLLSWILDSHNKSGLIKVLLSELHERGAATSYGRSVAYDVEQMKLLLEETCAKAGVKIQLHTRLVSAVRDASNRVTLAMTESKSGRQAWAGKVFIDTTGDGDLAARAGCVFDYGHAKAGQAQPMSMIALLTGLDPKEVAPFVRGLARKGHESPKLRLLAEMERAGVSPSYAMPTMFYIRDDLFCFMANHEYGVSATDAAAITEATLRARAEVHRLVGALRSLGGVWKSVRVVATPEHIGVREGRRIRGRYRVTQEDLVKGARHADAVCRVTFPVDVHSLSPTKTKGIAKSPIRAKSYDVPYRALVAKDVDNLLMAGRCISGDFIAHSSYRVTGNAVPMGEAAGAAAALSAKNNYPAKDVPWPDIRKAVQALTSS